MWDINYFLNLLFSGISKGSIYALIALGYTMVYGIAGLINFSHGEVYMIGAFVGMIFAKIFLIYGMPSYIILPLALIISSLFAAGYGYTIEKVAYRPLRNSGRLSVLITAIGMSIFLQNFVSLGFSSQIQPFPNLVKDWSVLSYFSKLSNNIFQGTDILIILTTIISMITLAFIINNTRTGMAIRAVSQDKTMSLLLGINVDKIISSVFIIGSVLAAVAGVLIGINIGQINFFIGFLAGLKAFTAAVLGGIGNIPGAVLGGILLGISESFASGYISSEYEDAISFILLVFILIFRPAGLLGKKEINKV